MNWWQRWKAKHWDEGSTTPANGALRLRGKIPPLRKAWMRFAKKCREHPFDATVAAAALFGVLATVIQWLR